MASWKESIINHLSNLINCNRLAANMSQVLCSSTNSLVFLHYLKWGGGCFNNVKKLCSWYGQASLLAIVIPSSVLHVSQA